MQPLTLSRLDSADYLLFERAASGRHELVAGQVVAMSGASVRHNAIVTNLVRHLANRLAGGPCRVYANDLQVRVDPTGNHYAYPDVVIACGEHRFEDSWRDTLLNPTVLVEVLSPSTEAYDRGAKAELYRGVPSLREYLLVAQERRRVEHFQRQDRGQWLMTEAVQPSTRIEFPALGVWLTIDDIYDLTDVPR